MKKVTTIILLAVLTVSIAVMLFACNTTITDDIKLVDGYYVYKIPGNASTPEDRFALFGAQDDKIINGVLIVPKQINGTKVTELGFKDLVWVGEGDPIPMYKNDKIKKIVINHEMTIYDTLFANLKELKELQCNAKVFFYYNVHNSALMSVKLTNKSFDGSKILSNINNLRSLKLVNNNESYIHLLCPEKLISYFIPNATQITSQIFSNYKSLTSIIIPETVMEINKESFTNSNIDVFVRHTKENCPEGLKNGWDEGVNVVWGFEDEIVVFDTFDGSAIQCGGTNKNYQIAKIGEKLQEPAQPTKEGYTFTGWYKDYALSEQWNFDTDLVEESTVLVAGWQKNN